MICLVARQQELFNNDLYNIITPEESLKEMATWKIIQVDSETSGGDPHICDFLCVQFGNDKADKRIVVDTSQIDICLYKDILESKFCIFQNAKFDLKFFFKHGIIIRKVYDTMIVEQVLHLGFPHISLSIEEYNEYNYSFPYHESDNTRTLSYALDAITKKRLNVDLDKTVRGEIHWRGLDSIVINYAALTYWGRNKVIYFRKQGELLEG